MKRTHYLANRYTGRIPMWHDAAACKGDANHALFFPQGESKVFAESIRQAKAICEHCPVRSECLQWALDTNAEYGIWGGATEDERRAIRRARRTAARLQARRMEESS